jgi:hypothetical protein
MCVVLFSCVDAKENLSSDQTTVAYTGQALVIGTVVLPGPAPRVNI